MIKYLYILLIIIVFISCEKENIENDANVVNYITKTDEDQIFDYYYDDGMFVLNGLDEYILSIKSEKGTFTKEQLLLMTFKTKIDILPDSITPFTFILGTNYFQALNKNAEIRINTNYPYNNTAHTYYADIEFYKEHIEDMVMYKFERENNSSYYYDPNIQISEQDFSFDKKTGDVIFYTNDITSSYALCWQEKHWKDSISFNFQDNGLTNTGYLIEKGIKNIYNNEGAIFNNKTLNLVYSYDKIIKRINSHETGWLLHNINITILNPEQKIIPNNTVDLEMIIVDKEINDDFWGVDSLSTFLEITNETIIEIIQWPELGEKGLLKISGPMQIRAYQRKIHVNFELYFYRQR